MQIVRPLSVRGCWRYLVMTEPVTESVRYKSVFRPKLHHIVQFSWSVKVFIIVNPSKHNDLSVWHGQCTTVLQQTGKCLAPRASRNGSRGVRKMKLFNLRNL